MTDLDDFFKKKDRKRANKKPEEVVKATDLFKVLDNAAQNGLTEDLDEERNYNKPLELGPVLSEVVNPEEASKWSEPVEEERYYDLSNLKIDNLIVTEEEEAAAREQSAQQDEPVKSGKIWAVPAGKGPQHTGEVKQGTPGDRRDEASAATSTLTSLTTGERKERKTLLPDVGEADKKVDEVPESHGILETVVSGVESVIGSVVGAVSGFLHLDRKDDVLPDAATGESSEAPATVESEKASEEPKKNVYVPRHVQEQQKAEAAALAAAGKSSSPAAPAATRPTASGGVPAASAAAAGGGGAGGGAVSSTGAYKSPGQLAAEREAKGLSTASGPGGRVNNYKKPELDNEEEFPTLGGGGGKHK